jgi:hypothetical protein
MMGLSSHINVWNTCLRLLREKGYALHVEGELDQEGMIRPGKCLWIADKEGFHFCGDTPIELLGLTAVYEFLQPLNDASYWWRIDGSDIVSELYEKAFPDSEIVDQ